MEQLFVVQIDAFLARNPQRCELRGNLIKHKVWGGFFGALGPHGAVQGHKRASPGLMFYKVSVKFTASRRPFQKRAHLDNKQLLHIDFHVFEKMQNKKLNLAGKQKLHIEFSEGKKSLRKKSDLECKQLLQIEKSISKIYLKWKINMEQLFSFENEEFL